MPLLLHTDSFNLSPGSCIAVSLNECSSSEVVTWDEVNGFITLASKGYIPNFLNPDLIVLGWTDWNYASCKNKGSWN